MFTLFYRFFIGYIEIEARGFAIERFLNLAIHNHTTLWDIKREGTLVKFKANVRDFYRLYTFAKKSGVKLKIIKKFGCPFFIYRYRKRYVFAAGILIFSLLILYMSSFIWLIDIQGNEKIEDYEILSVLNEKGLKIGAFKYTLNTNSLEEYVRLKIDQISWLHVKIDGTRATVTVTEGLDAKQKDINAIDNMSPCDIIADKDALITDIIATSGRPVVKVGDMVSEGDTLISADITYLMDGQQILYNQVYSSGTIKGKVTRSLTQTVPCTISLKRYTQNTVSKYNVKIFNTNFNTNFLKNDVSFKKYDIIREIKQLGLGEKFMLPIYVEKESYKEYNIEKLNISEDEAKQLAIKQLDKRIIECYSTDCDILSKDFSFTENNGNITACAKVTAIENLGKKSYIVPIINQGGNAINGTTENTNSE